MSQIAVFTLYDPANGKTIRELPDGGCSGMVYTALLAHLEEERSIDCHALAPQEFDTLDCARFDSALAKQILAALRGGPPFPELAAQIGADWEIPAICMERALQALQENLEQVRVDTELLYELV